MKAPTDPFLKTLSEVTVVAVIRAASADAAVATSHALVRGGVTGIEVTFSTPGAADAIRRVKEELPSALIGAGTVLEIAELDAACDAGAKFLVSPHFDPALLDRARERGVPYLPGALTPTEIVRAWKAGASCVKLFPGSAVGPGYVKAIRGPLPDVPLMPTGGVDEKNLGEWLKAGVVAVGMGGALATGTLDEIEVASRRIMGVLKTILPAR
jgi:2-dehydro-3-deoxyphosphogluconate aldolase/(4S)-4-hydroxy-2-oxoglutarate aldolase